MIRLRELWSGKRASIPDVHQVVVATSRQLGPVRSPFEATDLRSMGDELGYFVLGDTDVVVIDETASRA